MAAPHVYDRDTDGPYDFDQFEYYLTEAQITTASEKVKAADRGPVLLYIAASEKVKRESVLGCFCRELAVQKCRELEDAFRKETGGWAYQTEAYGQFYDAL